MLKVIQEDAPWYREGLCFECTGCGKCCTGAPGYVWVDDDEINAIADYLNLSLKEFSRRYLRKVNGKPALIEISKRYDCVFLKDNKCEIYPVRPKQCRTFPWWPEHLKSKEAWQEAARSCEGICDEAAVVPYEKIEEQRKIQEEAASGK